MVLINAHYVWEFSCDSSLSTHRPVVRGVIGTLLKSSSEFKISLSTHSESSDSTISLKEWFCAGLEKYYFVPLSCMWALGVVLLCRNSDKEAEKVLPVWKLTLQNWLALSRVTRLDAFEREGTLWFLLQKDALEARRAAARESQICLNVDSTMGHCFLNFAVSGPAYVEGKMNICYSNSVVPLWQTGAYIHGWSVGESDTGCGSSLWL